MKLVAIENRAVTMELEPEDCLVLARALAMAERSAIDSGVRDELTAAQVCGALKVAFEAAAMAGASRSYLRGREFEQFTLKHVRQHLSVVLPA